jgi:hypothetical protein
MNPDINNPAPFASPGLPHASSEADRNGSRLDSQEQAADTEELDYDLVPPKQTVTVSVRYRIRGRGQPLPYPLDEEDGQ